MRTLVAAVLLVAMVPIAMADEGTCAPLCEVLAESAGYLTPATILTTGSTITWTSIDGFSHPTGPVLGNCFLAGVNAGGSASASFRIADGKLFARVGTTERQCTSVTASPDGSFGLQYYCLAHTQLMRGVLVITPLEA